MGLRDRIARALVGDIEKAPRLPAGSVTMTEQEMRQSGLAMQQTYGNSVALPRAPFSATVPFGPGMPITPGAINPIDPATGRPMPRRYEYQVAQNINVTENVVGAAWQLKVAKTHCPKGHPYDEENTWFDRKRNPKTVPGFRHCRACHRERERARRAKLKEC